MGNFISRKAVAIGLLLTVTVLPHPAMAVQAGGGMRCGVGNVDGWPQEVCYWDGGIGGGGDFGGGGGGGRDVSPNLPGGGGPGGVWIDLGNGNKVNLTKKQVQNSELGCSDETILLARAAQSYLSKDPYLKLNSVITLVLSSTGETQKFERAYNSGSVQFGPVSSCGK